MIRQYELVERVKSYDPGVDEEALNRAYVYTVKAHGTQRRASGDPYFSHPVEVAGILSSMKLDSASIITGLLHDTVEDTEATIEEIEELFGQDIARLVDGVTKLSRIELQSDQSKQAENFRKLVLAMSEDIRVLLVKLADRLHNMRTLHFLKDTDKRKRIARETLDIYAPLAERIGIHEWKDELEDLAFGEINPEIRRSILARLDFLRDKSSNLVQQTVDELKRTLANSGIDAWVSGREKRPYSIWLKMQHKAVEFEQLSDIVAFRIVVKTIEDCYRTLGVIHNAYRVVPGRFKDYVSNPKANGYRSLHTAVFGPQGQRVEVQIRNAEMHEVAEFGVAAHGRYKQGDIKTDGRQYAWLRELLDILEHAAGPEEFLEHTKLEMFQDQVFCFSPKGEVFALPRGATPVDFAYAVHSAIGDNCVGAKINGRLVPLRTQLANGDQVEIVTSKAQTPNPTWERFVVTGRARARIRRYVRTQQRQQYMSLGREILDKAFRQAGEQVTEKALDGVLKAFKSPSVEELYVQVGEGHVTGAAVVNAVFPGRKEKAGTAAKPARAPRRAAKAADKKGSLSVPVRGLIPGMAVHYAGCCHPLPGDRIVGIVTTGKGVSIHTIDCETLEQYNDQPERWIDVGWEEDATDMPRVGRIDVVIANEPGSLGNLTTAIGKSEGNIHNLKITNRSQDFFEILVDIEVRDVKHLTNIIAALRATPSINSVERARG
ncbi:MAG: bifunctional (p)ppGpp synthetase/guanosine-3',5'-bis(diphosphate) 3'-pyrophosphohydrolase [Alphaproteobacteria bacterium]|nr:bifunctional (p)ppGpp synthetase/guanosine-3',5'-bis(diphosphate) 3'-pyrophosphohydrolase [Alphaproteobacteria bacterium]